MDNEPGVTARPRGSISRRGDAYWVRVYAGTDYVTNKDLYIRETYYSYKEAEKARTRVLAEVDAGRAAHTNAAFRYLLAEWLKGKRPDLAEATYNGYGQQIRDYIAPVLGDIRMTQIHSIVKSSETLFAELAICWRRCDGEQLTDHYRAGRGNKCIVREQDLKGHHCIKRCRPHQCKPAAKSTVRQMHTIITGALKAAKRWGWITVNPGDELVRPRRSRSRPEAPTVEQAAAIISAAFEEDFEWAVNVWLLFVTSARRSEHTRMQLKHINIERLEVLADPTKTDNLEWISIDEVTGGLLVELRDRIATKKAKVGKSLTGEEYIYSYKPMHDKPGNPSYFSHRFSALAQGLGFHCTPRKARHFTASELIASGVDPVSVARRLNHASPKTTLDFYSAWRPRGDAHAVSVIADRLPTPPSVRVNRVERDYSAEQTSRISPELEDRICELRRRTGWGPKRIRAHLEIEMVKVAESTIWKVLKRQGLNTKKKE